MYINESRRGSSGIGFLALQDHGWQDEDVTLDQRVTIMGVRVKDRWRDETPVGYYKYDEESVGDIIGSFLWTSNQGSTEPGTSGSQSTIERGRELHGWRFTPWPVRTKEKKPDRMKPTTQAGRRGKKVAQCTSFKRDDIKMLPLEKWNDGLFGEGGVTLDERFKEADVQVPQQGMVWPSAMFPKPWLDCYGIAVSMDNEQNQDDLFMQTDPRMIAVNVGGDPAMGSLVCDLQLDCTISKVAPLQSAFRVVSQMAGCVPSGPFLALQIGKSGCGDTLGGVAWDTSIGGFLSQNLGSGPLIMGGSGCKHKVSQTEIGRVNSAHISSNAYFWKHDEYDAPLKFDERYTESKKGTESFEVFLEYDDSVKHPHVCGEKDGIWRWRSTATCGSSTTGGIPKPKYET